LPGRRGGRVASGRDSFALAAEDSASGLVRESLAAKGRAVAARPRGASA